MKLFNQNQHKIPQVYLRKFGFQKNEHWKISILNQGEKFTRQKSIESFLSCDNFFDIESEDINIIRIFEKLNCDLENEYNNIISELDIYGKLSDKNYILLITLVANLIVRTDYWRTIILEILKSPEKKNFLKVIIGHNCINIDEFKDLENQTFFKILLEDNSESVLNRVLIYFIDHLMKRLKEFDIIIIKSQSDKPWFTSNNPVVAHNRTHRLEIMAKESELYFPISPQYLAYIHCNLSNDKENPLRSLKSNQIYDATDEQNQELIEIVLVNPSDCIIVPGEFKYRIEDK